MKKAFPQRLALLCGVMVLLVFLAVLAGNSRVCALDKDTYRSLKVFTQVLDLVEKNYVEPVSAQTLLQGAISGVMKTLDPHSAFMTPEMYKELEVETTGSFGGIGIEISLQKDILTVVTPIEDTPAFDAGVLAGDQIIKIDGKSTKDMTITEAIEKLRGPENTQVTITILREGLTRPKDITITRKIIKINSVKTRVYDGNIGYIRISAFQERTADDLKRLLKEMMNKTKPLTGIVIDLRNNGGGLLPQSIEVSDVFLKEGTIVAIRGRTTSMSSQAVAHNDGIEPTCPLVVLVNEATASAAEIVSGALQDNRRALLVGTKTFGKGSVQTVIPLEDGAALKLTTAKYYTPSGRCIQAEGIMPDVIVRATKASEEIAPTEERPREKDLEGHIKAEDEEEGEPQRPQTLRKKEDDDLARDNQLKSAVDILKSWQIFQKVIKS